MAHLKKDVATGHLTKTATGHLTLCGCVCACESVNACVNCDCTPSSMEVVLDGWSVEPGCFECFGLWWKVTGTLDGTYTVDQEDPSFCSWVSGYVTGLTVECHGNDTCTDLVSTGSVYLEVGAYSGMVRRVFGVADMDDAFIAGHVKMFSFGPEGVGCCEASSYTDTDTESTCIGGLVAKLAWGGTATITPCA